MTQTSHVCSVEPPQPGQRDGSGHVGRRLGLHRTWRFSFPRRSVCTCEQLSGTSVRYACSEEHDHECKPSPHRHPSASTSGEKAEQAARADCGSTGGRTGCARSKAAANVFTIPLDDERETASSGGLAGRLTEVVIRFRSVRQSGTRASDVRVCSCRPLPSSSERPSQVPTQGAGAERMLDGRWAVDESRRGGGVERQAFRIAVYLLRKSGEPRRNRKLGATMHRGDASGQLIPANWPPEPGSAEFTQVNARVSNPFSTPTDGRSHPGRVYIS